MEQLLSSVPSCDLLNVSRAKNTKEILRHFEFHLIYFSMYLLCWFSSIQEAKTGRSLSSRQLGLLSEFLDARGTQRNPVSNEM